MATQEASPRTKKLVVAGLVPVVAFCAWGMSRAPLDPTAMRTAFMQPYNAAVDAGRYAEAWQNLTDPSYRQTVTLAAFTQALTDHAQERGRITERTEVGAHGFADAHETGFNVEVRLTFDHGPGTVVYYRVLHEADGTWRLGSVGEWVSPHQPLRDGPW